MKNIFFTLLSFILMGSILYSCKNSLDIAAPKEEITVVYAMIDANDPTAPSVVQKNYFKIYRAFLDGERDVYEVAQQTDSIYYNSILARLVNIETGNTILLSKDTISDLNDGIFPTSPNIVYSTTAPINEFTKYKLNISLPNGKTINSETKTLGNSQIQVLGTNGVNFLPPGRLNTPPDLDVNIASIVLDTSARLYSFTVRFRFNEVFADGTENPVMVEWKPLNNVPIQQGSNYITIKINNGMEFFYNIADKVKPKDGVIRRNFNASGCIEFVFTTTGKEFSTYREVNIANSGLNANQIFEPYSNIVGGKGIFTGRNVQSKGSVGLSNNSIVELRTGTITGHLLFQGI
jgi:hypothetical protein